MKIPLSQETQPIESSLQTLPTMYDLPSEDAEEPGLPDTFHELQPQILQLTFQPQGWESEEVFSATDLNLYYDLHHPLWHKRPDWFGVVGVDRFYEQRDLRLSYVIWQERVSPLIVVELLSPGTEAEDLGETVSQRGEPPTKWEVYEQILKILYYAVFSRYTNELRAFQLIEGYYQPVDVSQGYLEIPEIGLKLGLWRGKYRNFNRMWLRWLTQEGELILLPEEETEIAQQQAAEAQQRAAKLAEKLRELGINPDKIV
jgi:Uma2 family endonuclease